MAYLFDPHEWVIVMKVPGATRVVFRLREDEDASAAKDHGATRARLDRFTGPGVDYKLHSTRIYRVHQRVAERFRVGRVFLAGDAAHINNPAGGMGMNSGVHDAEALAKALVAAMDGDEGALDTYAKTRRKVAVDAVQAHTDKHYAELGASDEDRIAKRNASYRRAAADPTSARAWLLQRAMIAQRLGGA